MSERTAAPEPQARAHIAVSVATLWTAPRLDRPDVDGPSLTAPADPDAWNANMPDTERRAWLTGRLETQALLGTEVILDDPGETARHDDWVRVLVPQQRTPRDDRGYPGWVPRRQLAVDPAFASAAAEGTTALVTADRTRLVDEATGALGPWISFTTELPVLGVDGEQVRVAVPGAGPARIAAADVRVLRRDEPRPAPSVEDVIATGERFLGLRYLWAGMSSFGFDCSGFVASIHRHHGIDLPRDAGPQRDHSGLPRVAREDLRRGDLVFFSDGPGAEEIRHVAIWVGDGMIMQAPNAAGSVERVRLADYDVKGEYAGAVRVLGPTD